jgi:uncharacterized protein (DUF952 family)
MSTTQIPGNAVQDITYTYKILPSAPPSPLPTALPLSDLDAHDGFIHTSLGSQVPVTAERFFASHDALWVLRIEVDKAKLHGEVVWAPTPDCIHLYAPGKIQGAWVPLGKDIVENVRECKKGEDGSWTEAFKSLQKEGWLA